MRSILALTSPIGAGKATVAKVLEQKYNFVSLRYSGLLKEELERLGRNTKDRKEYAKLANGTRERFGAGYWSTKMIEKISELDPNEEKSFVLDGIRNIGEYETLKEKYGRQFLLVAIDVPQEIRYKRTISREGQYDDSDKKLTFEEFQALDEKELRNPNNPTAVNIAEIIEQADIVISNAGDLEDLEREVEKLLEEIQL